MRASLLEACGDLRRRPERSSGRPLIRPMPPEPDAARECWPAVGGIAALQVSCILPQEDEIHVGLWGAGAPEGRLMVAVQDRTACPRERPQTPFPCLPVSSPGPAGVKLYSQNLLGSPSTKLCKHGRHGHVKSAKRHFHCCSTLTMLLGGMWVPGNLHRHRMSLAHMSLCSGTPLLSCHLLLDGL